MLRATVLALTLAAIVAAAPAFAQMPSFKGMPPMSGGGIGLPSGRLPFKGVLDQASDNALDKLSKPGAFQADQAVRIALPGAAGGLGGMMAMAGKAGVGGNITAGLNDAAGQAAGAAKPIFRAAIDRMSAQDAVSIGTGGSGAATSYLRKSAGPEIQAQITPLVRAALGRTGVLSQASQLQGFGMNEGSIIDYVARKTADGIFLYMSHEEARLRQNPGAFLGR